MCVFNTAALRLFWLQRDWLRDSPLFAAYVHLGWIGVGAGPEVFIRTKDCVQATYNHLLHLTIGDTM
jgi:hypothetical protein